MATRRNCALEKLKEAFELFPRLLKEMKVVHSYCVSSSTDSQACTICRRGGQGQGVLGNFISEHQVAQVSLESLNKNAISSIQEFALVGAEICFWQSLRELHQGKIEGKKISCASLQEQLSKLSSVVEHLQSLVFPVPVAEHLQILAFPVPSMGHGAGIWKMFAAAEALLKQICVVAGYSGRVEADASYLEPTILRQIQDLLVRFQGQHLRLVREASLSSQVEDMLKEFAKGLVTWHNDIEFQLNKWICWNPIQDKDDVITSTVRMMKHISLLVSTASKIAEQLLPRSCDSDLGSWSIVSSEVASVASGHSVDSQTSVLSGHGGPHCFLPGHLFKRFLRDAESSATVLIQAKDLCRGTKILAGDGNPIEVTKVEGQKANKLIDNAEPFITTPNHRIVMSDGHRTMKAMELQVGNFVMCSDGVEKMVIGKKVLDRTQEVLAITFNPDIPVACFSPEKPVVLSKGLTRKPPRRGGQDRRVRRRLEESEGVSMPDTAPGEYED